MTNLITLSVPQHRQSLLQRAGVLIDIFANHRRHGDDVFWLKENAELLNILECTATEVPAQTLSLHQDFYDRLPQKIGVFPTVLSVFAVDLP